MKGEIIIGKADVDPGVASHVPGVHEGNWPARARIRRSHRRPFGGPEASGSARRSTGISARHHRAIDPRMPALTPP